MVKLALADRNALIDIIADASAFQSPTARVLLLKEAGLTRIISTLSLELPTSQLLAGQLVDDLCGHGRDVLGCFVTVLARRLYDPEAEELGFLHRFLMQYQLPLPTYGKVIDPVEQLNQLEHATNPAAFLPVSFLENAVEANKAVALVSLPAKNRVGTCFLVGKSLLLTNNHILELREDAQHAIFRFNYQLTADKQPAASAEYRMKPGGLFVTNETYDYSFVEVAGTPGEQWGYLPLREKNDVKTNDPINIIQHPGGGWKQVVCTIGNVLVAIEENQLIYTTATESGSSGSPVFTNEWQVVALHLGGHGISVQNRPASRNRGTRIDVILKQVHDSPVQRLINC